MGCNTSQTTTCGQVKGCSNGFVVIIVLYILLAIILSSVIC